MNYSYALETDLIRCVGCNEVKPRTEFKGTKAQCKNRKCKNCIKKLDEVYKKERRELYRNDPERANKIREKAKQYYAANKEKCKTRIKERTKKPEVKARINERFRERRRTNIQVRLGAVLRTNMRRALNGNQKAARFHILSGCSVGELISHIESKWLPGMSWDNYGPYSPKRMTWHVDHIIPCTVFDLSKSEEQHKCFNYNNLQPLWAIDNIKKGVFVPDYQI